MLSSGIIIFRFNAIFRTRYAALGPIVTSAQLHAARVSTAYPEELLRGSVDDAAVLDLGLFGEVFGRLDRRLHALDGEERGQVGRVRRDDDQREEPPDQREQISVKNHQTSVKNHQMPPTIRPDTDLRVLQSQCDAINNISCTQKLTGSPFNLPHGPKTERTRSTRTVHTSAKARLSWLFVVGR